MSVFAEYAREILPILLEMKSKDKFLDQVRSFCSALRGEKEQEQNLLTPREQEIMECVLQGMKNKQIGEELHLALVTVEKNLSSIYRKLGVKNRAGAITAYQRSAQIEK